MARDILSAFAMKERLTVIKQCSVLLIDGQVSKPMEVSDNE